MAEVRQDSFMAPPVTVAAYRVRVDDIVDFSGGFDGGRWAPDWSRWDCDWKAIARIDREDPPTWILSDALIAAGRRGLLFPSTRLRGGTNLVLFCANVTVSDGVAVHDPHGDLPLDQSSWPARRRED
jgi:RES domain-containing protein